MYDFRIEQPAAYQRAVKLKLINKLNLIRINRNESDWSDEEIIEIANKHESRIQFSIKSPGAYKIALNRDLLGIVFPNDRKKRGYWNEETIKFHARGFKRRTDFKKKYPSADVIARNLGIIEELGFENVGDIFNRCIYVIEFSDNSAYIGLTYDFEKRKSQHLRSKKSSVKEYIEKNNKVDYKFIKLTEYIGLKEAVSQEGLFLEKYKNNGWNIINRAKTGGIGGILKISYKRSKLSNEQLVEILSKYNHSAEITNEDRWAYRILLKRKYSCRHLWKRTHVSKNFNKELLKRKFSEYNSWEEFKENEPRLWKYMYYKKMLKRSYSYSLAF